MSSPDPSPDDTLLAIIVDELRMLRRVQVRSTYDFSRAPNLLWHLGRGNADVAAAFFRQLPSMGSQEIDAALASLGSGPDKMNLEDRMNTFALQVGAESTRTVRRWADQGFRLIARMILDWSAEEGHDLPLAEVTIAPDGAAAIRIEVACIMQDSTTMLRPEVRTHDGVLPWVSDPLTHDQLEPPFAFRAEAVASFPEDDTVGWFVEVSWLGGQEARYQVEMLPGFLQDRRVRVSWTKKGCELWWEAPRLPADAISY